MTVYNDNSPPQSPPFSPSQGYVFPVLEEGEFDPHAPYTGYSPQVQQHRRVSFYRNGEVSPIIRRRRQRLPIARRLFTGHSDVSSTKTTSKKEETEEVEKVSFCKSVIILAGACVIGISIIKTLGEYFRDRNSMNSL